jgi:hypothetical protein
MRPTPHAQGKAVNRLMHEHVTGGEGAECNVCFAAAPPREPGIACGAGHFTVRAAPTETAQGRPKYRGPSSGLL